MKNGKKEIPAQQDCPHLLAELAELVRLLTLEVAVLQGRVIKLEKRM